ncbi:MAG TPA: hypothetical protein VGE26_07315 [Sphingobacteriaceae bacterium]
MKKILISTIVLQCLGYVALSNGRAGADTVKVDPANVKTSFLKEGTNRYLVYFKKGKDSSRVSYQMWTRQIAFSEYAGKKAITVTQEWEDNAAVVHKVTSVSDRQTFAPLFHDTWWKGRGSASFDFTKKAASLNNTPLTDADTLKGKKQMFDAFQVALKENYILNWHLDLEVFPILPYQANRTFLINFYDPGFGVPKYQEYTVTGSDVLETYENQKVDCWLLTHTTPGGKEVFWISKKTREVLKLEQEFRGSYRYKIKLGFSV